MADAIGSATTHDTQSHDTPAAFVCDPFRDKKLGQQLACAIYLSSSTRAGLESDRKRISIMEASALSSCLLARSLGDALPSLIIKS